MKRKRMSVGGLVAATMGIGLIAWLLPTGRRPDVVIGAKAFTESMILAESAGLLAQDPQGQLKISVRELGGTQILWSALTSGEIHAYVDYTGTLRKEIFPDDSLPDEAALRQRLADEGISATAFLGFDNSYGLGMKEEVAERLKIQSIRDLTDHTDLRYGLGPEFLQRQDDGWPSLREKYQLRGEVTGLEHQLAYQALEAGDLDVVDVYTTDPAVKVHGLRVLEDDFFPRYDALLLYRTELEKKRPEVVERIRRMGGSLDNPAMLAMNESVEVDDMAERRVAAKFVTGTLKVKTNVVERTFVQRLIPTTRGHLRLVVASLFMAIIVAIPAGIVAAKRPALGHVIMSAAEIVQTIPGLALLVFLSAGLQALSLPSLGSLPVIIALFFYSLLPILRNTTAGIQGVPESLRESAQALGLTPRDQLLQVELPLSAPTILAGVKTTAVINVGYATLGGLIGATCYGEPIMSGLRKNSPELMMEGAVPAAVMALTVKWIFEWAERSMAFGGES